MAAILETTSSNAFSWMKTFEFQIVSLKYVLQSIIDNKPSLVQIMGSRRAGDKPLSEPMMV